MTSEGNKGPDRGHPTPRSKRDWRARVYSGSEHLTTLTPILIKKENTLVIGPSRKADALTRSDRAKLPLCGIVSLARRWWQVKNVYGAYLRCHHVLPRVVGSYCGLNLPRGINDGPSFSSNSRARRPGRFPIIPGIRGGWSGCRRKRSTASYGKLFM